MIKRSEILHTAWESYRETASLIGLAKFSRKHFAVALQMAWEHAKTLAYYVAVAAEETAEALANPAKSAARGELLDLQMKDLWTSADRARVSALNQAVAA